MTRRRRGKGMRPLGQPTGRKCATLRRPLTAEQAEQEQAATGLPPAIPVMRLPPVSGKREIRVVYVNTANSPSRREFAYWCKKLGIVSVAEHVIGDMRSQGTKNLLLAVEQLTAKGVNVTEEYLAKALQVIATRTEKAWVTAYTISGQKAAVETMLTLRCVLAEHDVLDCHVTHTAQGSGAPKAKAAPPGAKERREATARSLAGQERTLQAKDDKRLAKAWEKYYAEQHRKYTLWLESRAPFNRTR